MYIGAHGVIKASTIILVAYCKDLKLKFENMVTRIYVAERS